MSTLHTRFPCVSVHLSAEVTDLSWCLPECLFIDQAVRQAVNAAMSLFAICMHIRAFKLESGDSGIVTLSHFLIKTDSQNTSEWGIENKQFIYSIPVTKVREFLLRRLNTLTTFMQKEDYLIRPCNIIRAVFTI